MNEKNKKNSITSDKIKSTKKNESKKKSIKEKIEKEKEKKDVNKSFEKEIEKIEKKDKTKDIIDKNEKNESKEKDNLIEKKDLKEKNKSEENEILEKEENIDNVEKNDSLKIEEEKDKTIEKEKMEKKENIEEKKKIELRGVIGFSGNVKAGLKIHPDGKNIIYPIGQTIVIRRISNFDKCIFLTENNGPISCLAVSNSGNYIATGHQTHMGFKADVVIWDYKERKVLHKMKLHKVRVQDLCFSYDEKFLCTIGGQDDNNITVWDIKSGKPICGECDTKNLFCCRFFNTKNDTIIIGGKFDLKVRHIDFKNRKLDPMECNLGIMKRVINCIILDELDNYAYCGTSSGDFLCVQMNGSKNFKYAGPKKPISKGISSCCNSPDGNFLVGGSDGSLIVLDKEDLSKKKSIKLLGAITSIEVSPSGRVLYIGTSQGVIYLINFNVNLDSTILLTCHTTKVNELSYPEATSEIIVTCSINDIRVWNILKNKELLRIQVPNLECNCVCFSPDGKMIVSGWSDGKIRAFGPQSGKLIFVINDAHKLLATKKEMGDLVGVTAIAISKDNNFIVSGGSDGNVRLWEVGKFQQKLIATMKEHKKTITSICLKKDNSECVSASDDGSCIIWDLEKFLRRNIMYQQTYFKKVKYLNDESQIITTGSDKKITYWDAFDSGEIRVIEGAKSGEIFALDISNDGDFLVIGGQEKQLKVYGYDSGELIQSCEGHSGDIKTIKISNDKKFICSGGSEGEILLWQIN